MKSAEEFGRVDHGSTTGVVAGNNRFLKKISFINAGQKEKSQDIVIVGTPSTGTS